MTQNPPLLRGRPDAGPLLPSGHGRRPSRSPLPGLRRRPLHAALLDAEGEVIGHVHEVIVDVGLGRIAYALLRWGGFMGLGERLLLLPWRALAAGRPARSLRLLVPRERLDDAPSISAAQPLEQALPALGSEPRGDWQRALHRHYGVSPYWR